MKELNKHIHALRKDYDSHSLEEQNLPASPFSQFEEWMSLALRSGIPDPNALTLSTVSKSGKPSSRIVLLREFSVDGFTFYTNYNSKKAKDISGNSFVALNFFWPELERQIRVEGKIKKITAEKSDSYFVSRPIESQLGAWASTQSGKLVSRKELEEEMGSFRKKFQGKPVPRPPHWGGYIVKPTYFEFWQGRANRLHDRIFYSLKAGGKWAIGRLFP